MLLKTHDQIIIFIVAGSYTDSRGIELIRRDVEKFISERDKIQADYNNIYLINGATDGIRVMLLILMLDIIIIVSIVADSHFVMSDGRR